MIAYARIARTGERRYAKDADEEVVNVFSNRSYLLAEVWSREDRSRSDSIRW
jgi:hypothetical protein